MKSKLAIGIAASALLCAFLARPLWSGDEEKNGGGMEMPEWMKKGSEHDKLAKCAGSYDVEGEFMMEPGQPPMKSKSTAKFESILDGKFLQQTFSGEMMGMPFQGLGIDGYDRSTKKWTSFWCDSMGTASIYLTGESPDGGKTITFRGEMMDPDTGKMMKIRSVHTETGADSFTFEMFGEHDGKEGLMFKLTYTRKK